MVEIRRWTDDAVLWSSSAPTLAEAMCEAVRAGVLLDRADLRGADLRGAHLRGARLQRADLRMARLSGAELHGADLRGADLCEATLVEADVSACRLACADLRRAILSGADMSGADLACADMSYADFSGADMRGVDLIGACIAGANMSCANLHGARVSRIAPTEVLLAKWGEVSDDLCADLMRLDASAHPDPAAFDRWAADGPCPYRGGAVPRVANFREKRELWAFGPPPSIYDVVRRLLAERGAVWP